MQLQLCNICETLPEGKTGASGDINTHGTETLHKYSLLLSATLAASLPLLRVPAALSWHAR